jgi:hypothetical protein
MILSHLRMPLRTFAVLCSALLVPGDIGLYAQSAPQPAPQGAEVPSLAAPELDSLVAPIALYPDPLVAQILAASTYPLAIVEARSWLRKNSGLKGQDLVAAAATQEWDPSVQALVVFPSVLQRLDENLKWTTALGNAFLAQQEALMSSIQRLREKARSAGALQSNAQQKVEIQQVEDTKVIVIQPAQPEVIYVPEYNPAVVFGSAPVYAPYPVMIYPPPSGAVVAAGAIAFGVGVAMGAFFGGWRGGWGWGCSWGRHPTLYVNNTFINHNGFRGGAYVGRTGNGAWAHNPNFRRAVPYSNAAVAGRYRANPYGATGGVQTPRGSTAGISGPNGSAAAVSTRNGSAARMQTPADPAVKTPRGTYTNPKPSAFGGNSSRTMMDSNRGSASMGRPGGMGRRR